MRQVIEKGLQLFCRPPVALGDFRITKNPVKLRQDGVRDDQVELLGALRVEKLRRRATRTEDRTHEHVSIQDDAHHTLRRLVLVRTARTASRTSSSITSGLTI
jgi:hypothetical protein